MDEDTKKLLTEATDAVVETRKKVEAHEIGMGEMQTRIDKIGDDLATATKAAQLAEANAKRVDEIETRLAAIKELQVVAGVKPTEHREAIREYLRTVGGTRGQMPKTEAFMASEAYKTFAQEFLHLEGHTAALTEGTFAEGGIFLDPELDAEILKNYVSIDPIRSVADVRTISKLEIKGYRRVGTPTAYHDSELPATGVTPSRSTYAEYKIPAYPLTVITLISSDMLDDVRYVESEITSDAGEALGYTEGIDFLEGTAVDRAAGIFFNHGTDSTKYPADVTGAGTAVISADDFATMYTTLLTPYRANSTWGFNSDTLKKILILKEATTNAYIWQPGLQAGPPAQIYGRPFIICESMDNEGNDYYPIMLGDFKKGYRIADRSGIVLLRDPYTGYPGVYFKTRKRVGGQVIKPEAIKILKTT